jgi:hypothetical protein
MMAMTTKSSISVKPRFRFAMRDAGTMSSSDP